LLTLDPSAFGEVPLLLRAGSIISFVLDSAPTLLMGREAGRVFKEKLETRRAAQLRNPNMYFDFGNFARFFFMLLFLLIVTADHNKAFGAAYSYVFYKCEGCSGRYYYS
jgi:hypothetical protein